LNQQTNEFEKRLKIDFAIIGCSHSVWVSA